MDWMPSCAFLRSLYYVAVQGMIIGSVMKTPIVTVSVPFARQIGRILKASILITADFTSAGRKSRYPGYIELKDLSSGEREIKYRDPDGKLHPLGKLTLP